MTEWTAIVWTFVILGAMVAMTIYRKNEMEHADFSWRHYTKPTPKNILGFVSALRRILGGMSAITVLAEAHRFVPATFIISMLVIDELKNFFAMVNDDVTKESVTAEFPSGQEVTVTHKTPKDEGEG